MYICIMYIIIYILVIVYTLPLALIPFNEKGTPVTIFQMVNLYAYILHVCFIFNFNKYSIEIVTLSSLKKNMAVTVCWYSIKWKRKCIVFVCYYLYTTKYIYSGQVSLFTVRRYAFQCGMVVGKPLTSMCWFYCWDFCF